MKGKNKGRATTNQRPKGKGGKGGNRSKSSGYGN